MAKGKVIAIVIISLIVVAAVSFGLVFLFTFGTISKSFDFYYNPATIQSTERVSFNSDIGNINIKYNTTPTENVVDIKLDVRVTGALVAGRSFEEFFKNPEFLNSTSDPVKRFSFESRNTPWLFISFSRVNISVTLRSDIRYNISTFLFTGNVNLNIPNGSQFEDIKLSTSTGNIAIKALNSNFSNGIRTSTSTGNIDINIDDSIISKELKATISTGNINLNVDNCYFDEKIDLLTSTGNLNLKIYNSSYSSNHEWDLDTSTGNIWVLIHQDSNMNANVTGSAITSTGNIGMTYIDYSSYVGASFFGTISTGNYNRVNNGGFTPTTYNPFQSIDYASANFTYSLSLRTSTGNIDVAGTSD